MESGSHELEPLSQALFLCSQHVGTAVPNMTRPPVLDFHIKCCQISGSYYEAPNVSLCPVTEPKQ